MSDVKKGVICYIHGDTSYHQPPRNSTNSKPRLVFPWGPRHVSGEASGWENSQHIATNWSIYVTRFSTSSFIVHFPGSYISLPDTHSKNINHPILSRKSSHFRCEYLKFGGSTITITKPKSLSSKIHNYLRLLQVLATVPGRRSQLPIFGLSASVKLITAACRVLGIPKPSWQSFMDLVRGGQPKNHLRNGWNL